MDNNATRIVVVLDRSGSMQSVKQATIDGFNEFINGQKQAAGSATLKLVQFDDQYETVFDQDVKDIKPLTAETFLPRGNTALNDAMGKTIITLGEELAKLPEDKRPATVIFATITDGQENCSREYTQPQVAQLVKEQQDKYSWNFVFLGANQDAVLTAQRFHIPAAAAMTYNANRASTSSVYASLSRNTVALRASASAGRKLRVNFTEEDRKNAQQ